MSGVQSIPGQLIIEAGGTLVFGGVSTPSILQTDAKGNVLIGGSLPSGVFPLLASDGTVAAPSYAFANQPALGWLRAGTNQLTATVGGVSGFSLNANGPGGTLAGEFSTTGNLAWSSTGDPNAASDLFLLRDASGVLAQRNGTNPQTFRLYNTFTDASNYERLIISWVGNVATIGTEALGTGVSRPLDIIGRSITSQIGLNPATTTTQVSLNGAIAQPSVDFVDSSRTINNRVHELAFTSGFFQGRFINDAYTASTAWVTATGGQGLGLTSLLFGGTSATVIGFAGNAGQAQKTGFGTPTGGGVIANFPGATATLAQATQAIAQIILDLKALGFYGA